MQSVKFDENQQPFIDLGNGFRIRIEDEKVTDAKFLEKARTELNEDSARQSAAIDRLKELILAEENFEYPHSEDVFFTSYLRYSKHCYAYAFNRLLNNFRFQAKHKRIFESLTAESIRRVYEDDLVKLYPVRTKTGSRLFYFHAGKKWKPSRVSVDDLFRATVTNLQTAMLEPVSQINGVSVLLDMEGLSLSQIMHVTPSFAAMTLEWLQDCVPISIKGIYVVNNSYIFNIIFKIFKPFIHADFRDRIKFLGKNWRELHELVGTKCVGSQFGGELEAQEVDGKVLTEFLNLFNGRFNELNKGGFKDV